jgi:hypothetical protein
VLLVTAQWVKGGNFDAEYEVTVCINKTVIWKGTVTGHNRHLGWDFLVEKIVDTFRADTCEQLSTMADQLAKENDDSAD